MRNNHPGGSRWVWRWRVYSSSRRSMETNGKRPFLVKRARSPTAVVMGESNRRCTHALRSWGLSRWSEDRPSGARHEAACSLSLARTVCSEKTPAQGYISRVLMCTDHPHLPKTHPALAVRTASPRACAVVQYHHLLVYMFSCVSPVVMFCPRTSRRLVHGSNDLPGVVQSDQVLPG